MIPPSNLRFKIKSSKKSTACGFLIWTRVWKILCFLRRKLLNIFWQPAAATTLSHDANHDVILQRFGGPSHVPSTASCHIMRQHIGLFDHGITPLYHDSSRVGQLIKFINSVLSDTHSAPAKANVFQSASLNSLP